MIYVSSTLNNTRYKFVEKSKQTNNKRNEEKKYVINEYDSDGKAPR